MADNTKIEWADATVNYVNGCSVISAGCTNCYAMRLAGTRMKHHPSRAGLTRDSKAGPVWTGEVRANETALLQPLAWKRPRRIFWNAHGDLFHENVPDAWIDCQFAVMALTPQHTHMVLTKRPERMRDYLARLTAEGGTRWAADILSDAAHDLGIDEDGCCALANVLNGFAWWASQPPRDGTTLNGSSPLWPLPNVWLGTSVEDQRAADERIPHLLATPAAVRFLSCEPLLGPVDLECDDDGALNGAEPTMEQVQGPRGMHYLRHGAPRIDWVIAGGESGPGARPMHPDWARSLRDQCAAAGVAFHFKQWGEWYPAFANDYAVEASTVRQTVDLAGAVIHRVGKARAGRLLDGRTHDEFPGGPPEAVPINPKEVPY